MDKEKIWQDCLRSIKVSVSLASFNTWFAQTFVIQIIEKNERLIFEIGCPSSFVKNTIEERYYGLIQDTLEKITSRRCDIIFETKTKENNNQTINFETPLFKEKRKKMIIIENL